MTFSVRSPLRTVACLVLMGHGLMAHDGIRALAVSPNFASDQTVLAATGPKLLRSTDAGASWTFVPSPTNETINEILFSPGYAQDHTIFLAGAGGFFESASQGWIQLFSAPIAYAALSPNFVADRTLFLITVQGAIFESTDGGLTFFSIGVPSGLTAGMSVLAISPNFSVDGILLLGTVQNGIYRTTDDGSNWQPVTSGLKLPKITDLVFSPNFNIDKTAFALSYGSWLLKSFTTGKSWTLLQGGFPTSVLYTRALAVSPNYANDSTLLIGLTPPSASPNKGIYFSSDGGITFGATSLTGATGIISIAISPAFAVDRTAFAASLTSGLFKSTDGGLNWTQLTLPI